MQNTKIKTEARSADGRAVFNAGTTGNVVQLRRKFSRAGSADAEKGGYKLSSEQALHDATIVGPESDAWGELMNTPAAITAGKVYTDPKKRGTPNDGWNATTQTWGQWIEGKGTGSNKYGLSRHFENTNKDGAGYVFGACDTYRRKNAVTSVAALALDLDTGQDDLNAVAAKVEKLGYAAIIYTTHSHLKTDMALKFDAVVKAMKCAGEPTQEDVRAYLAEHKNLAPHIAKSATIVDAKAQTPNGWQILIKTDPVPKMRVIFPLQSEVEMVGLGQTQAETFKVFESKVMALADMLGVVSDKACTDPSRFFFQPAHPKGGEFATIIHRGKPLAWDDVKIEVDPFSAGGASHGGYERPDDVITDSGINATAIYEAYGKRLLIAGLCEAHDLGTSAPAQNDSGKFHIVCPFADGHSDSSDDSATLAIDCNVTEHGYAVVKCQHGSCADRKIADFIGKWIDDGTLTLADIESATFMLPVEGDEAGEKYLHLLPSEGGQGCGPEAGKAGKANNLDMPPSGGDISLNIADPLGKKLPEAVATLKARWAVVNVGGKVLFMPRPDPDHATGGVQFFSEVEFIKFHKNRSIVKKGKKVNPAKVFAEDADRYAEVTFAPTPVVAMRHSYNLWNGFKVDQCNDLLAPCTKLKAFIKDVICGGRDDVFKWLWLWLAHVAQKPGEKPGTALVIQGTGGCGKSYFGTILTRLFAPYTVFADRAEHVTGQFNRHLATAVLLVSDEALFGGDPRISGLIKSLVTTNVQRIEAKGVDSIEVQSFLRCVFIGNPKRVVPIEANGSDRRYLCLSVADTYKDDTDYFGAIEAEIEAGGLGALFAELAAYDPATDSLNWNMIRVAPETEEKKKMRRLSLPKVVRKIIEAVEDGVLELRDETGRAIRYELEENQATYVARDHMRTAIAKWADARDGGQDAQEVLGDLFGDEVTTTRRKAVYDARAGFDGAWECETRPRAHCYVLPSRSVMQALIADRFAD